MPGVRIRHRTARSAVVLVEHPKAYKAPFLCPSCGATHLKKTYHVVVDHEGRAVVSEVIAGRLREARAIGPHGFDVEETIENPPPIVLNLGAGPSRFRVVEHRSR